MELLLYTLSALDISINLLAVSLHGSEYCGLCGEARQCSDYGVHLQVTSVVRVLGLEFAAHKGMFLQRLVNE